VTPLYLKARAKRDMPRLPLLAPRWRKGADPKPTPVRNVAKATESLHFVLAASFAHIIPRATIPHAILLGLCVLHISSEGWAREGWSCEGKCDITAKIERRVFMAFLPCAGLNALKPRAT
jgi:hypothetical protein